MKKTVLSLIIAVLMLAGTFAMTSCGSPLDGDDAIKAMQYVDQQMAGVKGFDGTMTVMSTGSGMVADVKVDMSGDSPKMYMKSEMVGMDIEATLIDDVMYVMYAFENMDGLVVKEKVTDEETIGAMMGDLMLVNDNYEYVSAEFVSRENGVYVIKAVISDEEAKDLIGNMDDLTVSDIAATITYECNAEGKASKVMIEISCKVEGQTVKSTIEMAINSLDIPAITAPADASEYKESTGIIG